MRSASIVAPTASQSSARPRAALSTASRRVGSRRRRKHSRRNPSISAGVAVIVATHFYHPSSTRGAAGGAARQGNRCAARVLAFHPATPRGFLDTSRPPGPEAKAPEIFRAFLSGPPETPTRDPLIKSALG